MDARLGTALEGRYTIDREIGAGGMATVYLARDLRHNRNVALKVLNPVTVDKTRRCCTAYLYNMRWEGLCE